ncbi:MAG: ribosomal protein L7/L12 [Planctomycetes bacterium]|nr:ribosomal protein L7/L12 [Planctomycetota bacterium]
MGTQSARPPATPDQEVDALLRAGQKIQAIKLVRERTGLGLKEAKDLVDEREQRLPGR